MNFTRETFEQILVNPGHLTKDQLDRVFSIAKEKNISPVHVISELGFLSDEHLAEIIADSIGLRFVDLSREVINKETITLIPEIVARSQKIIAYRSTDTTVYVASSEPENYEFVKLLEKKTGKTVEMAYTTEKGITDALRSYKSDLRVRVQELVSILEKDQHDESSIIKLVDLILEYAYNNGTSDIHIEPLADSSIVRFRIDGILHEVVAYPKALHEKIIFRIKIMSRLRTDEHAATQDGRMEVKMETGKFDVRVSMVPTTNGENVVMRLLTADTDHRSRLEDLGFSVHDTAIIRNAISKPYGMILSVGPTGSGKSTTLYALLQILNNPEVNVMTIEDPVEFNIDHVQQIPVNTKKNVTFATGLRSIVRQDPNIIMVGEIRDTETAGIAINAAMTVQLARVVYSITAIDPDEESVNTASVHNTADNICYKLGSAAVLNFNDELFDIVVFTLSLHHVPALEMAMAINEAVRVVKNDGYIVFLEPATDGTFFDAELFFDACDGDERKEKEFAHHVIMSHPNLEHIRELDDRTMFEFDSDKDFIDSLNPKSNIEHLSGFFALA